MIREERPIVLNEAQASLHEFAEQLADWIADPEGRRMHRVAAVYGDRGTGKTSVLVTVLEKLRQRRELRDASEAGRDRSRVVLPSYRHDDDRDLRRAIFAPAESRDGDDLLFLLLAHLEERYLREKGGAEALRAARKAEIRRKDIDRFLGYEQDISPSRETIPDRFVDIHDEVSRTTIKLREAFDGIVRACRMEHEQTLVLVIDDLDLQPHRALDLLEILGLFLNQAGVTVLLAADRGLLLHSIDEALRLRGRHEHPGLAAALLAKYVPHVWSLPVPSEDERMELMWSDDEPELPAWWPGADRDQASQYIGPLLPRSYRGLKALHNLLATLRVQYAREDATTVGFHRGMELRLEPLSVSHEWLPPVVAMMAALDVQYPHITPLAWLLDETVSLGEAVSELAGRDEAAGSEPERGGDEARPSGAGATHGAGATAGLPERVRRRIAPPYLDELVALRARDQLFHLLRTIHALRHRGFDPRTRFLAVSLNADAMAMAESVWQGRFARDEVEAWHIDLRELVENPADVRPDEIEPACARAAALLRERGVTDYPYPVWLHVKARLSMAIWLGWELRYLGQVTAYNLFGGKLAPLEAPAGRIDFRDDGLYRILTPEPRLSPADTFEQAVVLIDLLGDSTPGNLYEFELADGADAPAQHRFRLSAPPGQRIGPDDVVPLLEDAIELLEHLRRYNRVQRFHLAFLGPDVMAVFLGRQLNAMGRFSLYDRYSAPEPRYRHVLDIDTHG